MNSTVVSKSKHKFDCIYQFLFDDANQNGIGFMSLDNPSDDVLIDASNTSFDTYNLIIRDKSIQVVDNHLEYDPKFQLIIDRAETVYFYYGE